MQFADLLIEIGTEELPTQAVEPLSTAFAQNLLAALSKAHITDDNHFIFATPRRIAVLIKQVAVETPAQMIEHRGPPVSASFNADGTPKPAAIGFADKFKINVSDLEQLETDKGAYLIFKQQQAPQKVSTLLVDFIKTALLDLPIKKPMMWGDHTFKFVRPVHWVLGLFGNEVLKGEIFGKPIGNTTKGHRFLNNAEIVVDAPEHYAKLLFETGFVVANFNARKVLIKEKIAQLAASRELQVVLDEDLLQEVTCLVEWPVPLLGQFDKRFLSLPAEVIGCTLKQNQKTFVLKDKTGKLQPYFITVSNIDSKDPTQVIKGNEKVVHARLSDAEFFFAQDKKQTLEQRLDTLAQVVFQQGLGSLLDKAKRISILAEKIATQLNLDPQLMAHAGLLCKSDLVSQMVNEFPELQGIMGARYAEIEKQKTEVINGIHEHYQPSGAGDRIPASMSGVVLSLADKLDTLISIFSIGKIPTGDKDPFGLRRAAIGILRIMIEKKLALDLKDYVNDEVLSFILDRLDAWLKDQGFQTELFAAVRALGATKPYDIYLRVKALQKFSALPEAASLASAHKRINNLLNKQDLSPLSALDETRLFLPAEKQLFTALAQQKNKAQHFSNTQQYDAALLSLAQLKPEIDTFFDSVLVMDEDLSLRNNRLALLKQLGDLFLNVADLSHLPVLA